MGRDNDIVDLVISSYDSPPGGKFTSDSYTKGRT